MSRNKAHDDWESQRRNRPTPVQPAEKERDLLLVVLEKIIQHCEENFGIGEYVVCKLCGGEGHDHHLDCAIPKAIRVFEEMKEKINKEQEFYRR